MMNWWRLETSVPVNNKMLITSSDTITDRHSVMIIISISFLSTISQLQDLIMAAVDTQGTLKDFCSVTCLLSFRSPRTPQSTCSMCKTSCTVRQHKYVSHCLSL